MTTTDGFFQGLGREVWLWAGFIFTVGGTVVALVLVREYWWVVLLCVIVIIVASVSFAYLKHRGEAKAKVDHLTELNNHKATAQKLQEAEQRLHEVPLQLLARVSQIIESVSLTEVARLVADCAEVIDRHKQFLAIEGKPLALRTFVMIGDRLFAVAKASPTALQCLRVEDPFVLQKKVGGGVEVQVARLVVNQPPDVKDEVVHFAILPPIPPELEPIATLAGHGDVSGLKGYSVRPAYDASRYAAHDLSSVAAAIPLLIEDATRRLPRASS